MEAAAVRKCEYFQLYAMIFRSFSKPSECCTMIECFESTTRESLLGVAFFDTIDPSFEDT